ncbi:leucine-rich repeat serine/threonine-protein kinase 1-like isoform X2 [Dysidea avara]|uniref:leucine-rich repeat serine/threonine-protein kinase 1-like isoform X2 n=1 Tax=Dysidea avara TaxID=196820 RepID=UPI003326968B
MSQLVQELEQELQQQCTVQEGSVCRRRMLIDLVPANIMSEEQWIDFVLSQRGTDHVTDFFLTNFDKEILQWFVNKPLVGSSTGTTLLHVEARDKRYAVLSLLLKFGGSPNVTDSNLQTPVHHAVMNVSPLCLQTLLEWGGDLYQQDKDGKSPMDYMTNSSPLSFRLTIKQYCGIQGEDNDENDLSRFYSVILRNDVSLDEFKSTYFSMSPDKRFICMKSEVSNQTVLFRASKAGQTDRVFFLLSQTDQVPPANTTTHETPLHAACEGNHYDIVVELINKFPELLLMKDKLPYRGWYPIHTACAFGASDKILAEVLIGTMRLCIDFPHKFTNITFTDLCGQSPLYIAVTCGNLSHVSMYLHPLLVDTFLQVAPSLVAVNTSNIPTKCSVIHAAVLGGNNEIVSMLLDRFPQATMAMTHPCKLTMLLMLKHLGHYLNSYSKLPIICEHGNDELAVVPYSHISAVDKPFNQLSLSPLAVACALGRTEIVTTLLDAGGINSSIGLRIAFFMGYGEVIVNLLFQQQHEQARFIANDKNLKEFPISTVTLNLLVQCTEIDLQGNSLTMLPLALFQTPLLKYLDVSSNNLSTLPIGEENENSDGIVKWGWDCVSLRTLNIEFNAIRNLPEVVWEVPKLQWLNASHNCLVKISTPTHCNTLSVINVSHNKLTEVPAILFSVQEIDLSYNEIKSLPVELWQSKTINKLNVSHNSICELNFSGLVKTSLKISCVSFGTIGKSISSDESYKNTEQLDSICSLTKFNISHNRLNGFPSNIPCFATHLQYLNISYNYIGHLKLNFLPPYLKGLNAMQCDIVRFGLIEGDDERIQHCASETGNSCPHKAHSSLPHLSSLNLSGNKIKTMQFVSTNSTGLLLYPELKSLDLSNNDLRGDFATHVKLQQYLFSLKLSNNLHLESIPVQLSLLHESLFELQLDNLPNLKDPPCEYHKLPTPTILAYMKSRMQKLIKHHCLRVMVFGSAKTGKSTLINRIAKHKQTIPATHLKVEWIFAPSSSDEAIKFTIWDFNQDVISATQHCFCSKRALYLVVFNLVDGERGVKELETVLKNIKVHAPGCPVIIVGTHLDQVNVKNTSGLKELVDELYGDSSIYPIIATVTFVSSTAQKLKINSACKQLRKEIYYVATHLFLNKGKMVYQPNKSPEDPSALLQQMIPVSYLELNQDVLSKAADMRKSKTVPVLSLDEFCSSFMPSWTSEDDLKGAFHFLHHQGTILCHPDNWKEQIFCIDVQWLCDVVADILCIPTSDGIIPKKLFFDWFRKFSLGNQAEILELFAVYDIVMKLGESYFVPLLLPNSLSVAPIDNASLNFGSSATVTTNIEESDNQSLEPFLNDDVDNQQSSDEDDDPDYITVRLPQDGQYKKTSSEPRHNSEKSNQYLTVVHHNTPLPTGNNFYNVSLLNSASFEKSTDLLSPYSTYKNYLSTSKAKQHNATLYPPLSRIWLSSFIPDGYWPRLLHRIVSDSEIREVMLKLIPASQHSGKYSLWSLWQSGIAIVYKKTTWLELKHEANFAMDDGKLVSQYKNCRIFLSIYTNKFVELHENSSNTNYLSCETVLSLNTKLLVLIEQLILELEEWFPATLEHLTSGEVECYIPCYHCTQQGEVAYQFTYTDHIVLYHNELQHNIFCFSFKQLLQLYSINESPVCQRHGKFSIELCTPDIAFKDVQHIVCGPDMPLNIDKGKILGMGGSALVLRGELVKSRQLVAVKVITDSPIETATITDYLDNYAVSLDNYRMIRKEVSFLSTLHHENLTQLCGVSTNPFMLLIELAPLGSLRNIIKEYRAADMALTSPVLCKSVNQIASALAFLHQKHVIYFDLKSDNILVWKFPLPNFSKVNQNVWLKITDYGISRVSSTAYEIRTSNVSGTPGYIAPEVLLGKNSLQADKIDVFSYGMTVYELISLKMPFEKSFKIDPDANLNMYVTKRKRPALPVKGIWSPYLVQRVMNICWEHNPSKRPKISQVVEWSNLPEFESLRAVYHLEEGKMTALCQCQVDCNHIHSLDVDIMDVSKVKFTITPYTEDDPLLSFPVLSSSDVDQLLSITPYMGNSGQKESIFDFKMKKSRHYFQIWMVQKTNKGASQLQIFSYNDSRVGYSGYSTTIKTVKVQTIVNVGQYMWIYTEGNKLFVVHIPTMQNIACFLPETKLSVIELLHVPEWQVVIVLWRESQLWFIHDKIRDGLRVMDVIKLDQHDPVIHMCVVNLSERTEVWATQGDRKIVIFESSSDGFQDSDTLHCTVEKLSLFSYLIVCLCFTSSVSGNNMVHVWVSFNQRPHLVCWDADTRIQINHITIKEGYNVTSLLGHENQLYVGTSSGNIEVYDSECGIFLQRYSMHCAKVRRILKLPPEIHQCICAESFPTMNSVSYDSNITEHVSSKLINKNGDITPKERSQQEYFLQQSSSTSLPQLSYTAPLIVSIGDGLANWLNMGSVDKIACPNLELLTWTGYGHFKA